MNETTPQSPAKKTRKQPVKATVRRAKNTSKGTKRVIAVILALILVGAAGYGIYQFGKKQGIAEQKKAQTDRVAASRSSLQSSSQGRWTYAGKVTEVSDKSITIKTASGQAQTVAIDDKTTSQKLDGTKVAPKDIKKDTTVVVSGNVRTDGSSVAQRIRISDK